MRPQPKLSVWKGSHCSLADARIGKHPKYCIVSHVIWEILYILQHIYRKLAHIFIGKWLLFLHKLRTLDSLAVHTIQSLGAWFVCLRLQMPPSPRILSGDSKMLMTELNMIKFLFFKLRFLVIFSSFPYFTNFILFISMESFSRRIIQMEFEIIEMIPCD